MTHFVVSFCMSVMTQTHKKLIKYSADYKCNIESAVQNALTDLKIMFIMLAVQK